MPPPPLSRLVPELYHVAVDHFVARPGALPASPAPRAAPSPPCGCSVYLLCCSRAGASPSNLLTPTRYVWQASRYSFSPTCIPTISRVFTTAGPRFVPRSAPAPIRLSAPPSLWRYAHDWNRSLQRPPRACFPHRNGRPWRASQPPCDELVALPPPFPASSLRTGHIILNPARLHTNRARSFARSFRGQFSEARLRTCLHAPDCMRGEDWAAVALGDDPPVRYQHAAIIQSC
jgi:hypothetical protein